ncbi:GNAT family N-acetyltransferase [Parvularcula maris]|uniref:GNAT family N-acetyltransferase n=1 Tax=Parvularcula maris TaxID=2965077 RepID=A0A9X2RH80_9PROT|nr:GNAT family N-acetyltransferase [Parvularcula maris]
MGYGAIADDVPVGGGAFIGRPQGGRVEIAYYTLPEHEGRGFGTMAAQELVQIALAEDRTLTLTAKTLPQTGPSTVILERAGFLQTGLTTDEDVGDAWLWERISG